MVTLCGFQGDKLVVTMDGGDGGGGPVCAEVISGNIWTSDAWHLNYPDGGGDGSKSKCPTVLHRYPNPFIAYSSGWCKL